MGVCVCDAMIQTRLGLLVSTKRFFICFRKFGMTMKLIIRWFVLVIGPDTAFTTNKNTFKLNGKHNGQL